VDQIIRKATEIELQPNNMKRDDGLILSRTWNPLIQSLRQETRPPQADEDACCPFSAHFNFLFFPAGTTILSQPHLHCNLGYPGIV